MLDMLWMKRNKMQLEGEALVLTNLPQVYKETNLQYDGVFARYELQNQHPSRCKIIYYLVIKGLFAVLEIHHRTIATLIAVLLRRITLLLGHVFF